MPEYPYLGYQFRLIIIDFMPQRRSRNSKNIGRQVQLQELLKELRLDIGLKQDDLANILGVKQSYVSKYESGERRLDVFELMDICNALNISLSDFINKLQEKLR
jgi:DNA-binding transcriptional regulator YiaG